MIVVVSNQGGIALKPNPKVKLGQTSKLVSFKTKVSTILSELDLPLTIYAATGKDMYRKPRTGIWTEFLEDHDLTPEAVDFENSVFVGDAGGRLAGDEMAVDFSCCDRYDLYIAPSVFPSGDTDGIRNFAENIGLKFQTPEEYFLKEDARPFARFEPAEHAAAVPAAEGKSKGLSCQTSVMGRNIDRCRV